MKEKLIDMRKKHPNPNIQEEDNKAARRRDQFDSMRQPPKSDENVSGKKRTPKENKSKPERNDADDAETSI